MKPSLLTRFGIAFVQIFIALIVVEILFGWIRPPLEPVTVKDSRYLYKVKPSQDRIKNAETAGGTRLVFNRFGYRGPEPAEEKTKKRIVVYGDSNIQAIGTPYPDTFCQKLQAALGNIPGGAEVLNAGVHGYGPDQMLRRIEDEMPLLQPDLLIVTLFADNDFGDLIRNKLYRSDPKSGLRETDVRLPWKIRLRYFLTQSKVLRALLMRLHEVAVNHPEQFNVTQTANRISAGELISLSREEVDDYLKDDVVRYEFDHYDADTALEPDSNSSQTKRDLMEAVLTRIQKHAKEREVPLLFVIIPSIRDLTSYVPANHLLFRENYPGYRPSNLSSHLENMVQKQGWDSVNLFSSFSSDPDLPRYFSQSGDDHWSKLGQAKAAEIVAGYLRGRNLLAERPGG